MESIRQILSRNLKHFRKKAGMTQAGLTERAGISIRYYQDIEKAMVRWPQPDILEALAGALGIEATELFTKDKKVPNPTVEGLSRVIVEQEDKIRSMQKTFLGLPRDLIIALGKASKTDIEIIRAQLGLDEVAENNGETEVC